MVKRFPGASEAVSAVRRMSMEDLLQHIDSLYGRSYLRFGDDVNDVRDEAVLQTLEDFADYSEATEAEKAGSKYRGKVTY